VVEVEGGCVVCARPLSDETARWAWVRWGGMLVWWDGGLVWCWGVRSMGCGCG